MEPFRNCEVEIMIYITGDTHGDIDYKKLLSLKEKKVSYNDYLIICGDAGICWSPDTFQYHLDLYNDIGCTIIYVDGNHENFSMLEQCQVVEFCGALMHQVDKHIFHVLRGEIMVLEGKTFLCIGGAISTDKIYREPYISWWPEEEINNHDINNAIDNLGKVNYKVDYVITHCLDTKTLVNAFHFRRDVCTDQLNFIDMAVEYKHWYFGHYHFDRVITSKKTCLYNDIVEIGEDE